MRVWRPVESEDRDTGFAKSATVCAVSDRTSFVAAAEEGELILVYFEARRADRRAEVHGASSVGHEAETDRCGDAGIPERRRLGRGILRWLLYGTFLFIAVGR
jgi:hypothetical protein